MWGPASLCFLAVEPEVMHMSKSGHGQEDSQDAAAAGQQVPRADVDQDEQPRETSVAIGNQNARKHGAYARYVAMDPLLDALDLPEGDLRPEIIAARAVIQEVMQPRLDVTVRAQAFERAVAALVRLFKPHQRGGTHDELVSAMVDTLTTMGLIRDVSEARGGNP